jgi:hypothetical protein
MSVRSISGQDSNAGKNHHKNNRLTSRECESLLA